MQAVKETRQDIEDFASVTREDHANAVRGFQAAIAQGIKSVSIICGGCGKRDIEDPMHGPFKLCNVKPDHWLCVPREAFRRLKNQDDRDEGKMKLIVRSKDGGFVHKDVKRRDMLNMVELNPPHEEEGRAFHVVPEAVANRDDAQEACIWLCRQCHARFETKPDNKQVVDEPVAYVANEASCEGGSFPPPDLYHPRAPPNAIAGGHDYGRLSALADQNVDVDVSSLEMLVLAKARCHLVAIKVRKPRPQSVMHGGNGG